ncbi:S-locus glycoprotein [Corchorus olitorius]|uniref:Receptor-like serine/threonine-protein kinase n=1 Tax=Corchorus olitorius TaxID=93759 RepID=A0A1R3H3T2_9ROSI|nr:S-locus glycoprotein [Corchorus olitorius]
MRTITNRHFCNFFLFFTFLAIFPTISISFDTLTATQSIQSNQTLVSQGDVFELGFFTLDRPGEWYVGIWYKNIPQKTYVWVANRDNPLSDSSGIFKVENRNLVLLDQEQNPVWSSNITTAGDNNPVAQLLDTGNLVLREANSENGGGTNHYLWQSFDYPTDTLLPDMKLGWDLNTGFNRFLTAWRSTGDPSTGDFSFKLDYHGFPEIFLWDKQRIDYRSGPWNGVRFSGVPEMKPLDYINFNFVTNQDEVYYSFSITNKNIFSRLMVTPTGDLQRLTWIPDTEQWNPFWYAPKDQCDNYRECGPYGICDNNASPVCKCPRGFSPRNQQAWNLRDGSGGCVRKTDLDCSKDKFLHLPNMKLPESTTSYVDRNMNIKDCEALCARNCSCTAFAYVDIRNGGKGCVIWTGELIDMRQYSSGGGQDLFVRLAASDLGDGGNTTALIVGITVGAGVLLLGLIAFVKEYSSESKSEELELPLFDFETLAAATDNFSDENKLGQGGFGSVYMGTLVEGQQIAVKRLSKNSGQGVEEFKNEVRLIARLQHRNLVRLVGCCVEMDEKMLIYEYMAHRSLDSVLFNKARSSMLTWQRRFNIICGIARGLLYLHQDSRFRIIHRDLKASNILLDRDLNPKISDFGMARIFGGDQTEMNTKRVVGTYGYMSPEYAMDGLFSTKSDVFSFGVLVLEVVSGKKNRGFYHSNSELNLLGHAWRLWKEGNGLELIDSAAGESYNANEVLRCIHVGLLCVQERAEDRPSMSTVVLMLNSEAATMAHPKTPGFCLGRNTLETDSSTSKQDESCTVNQVTVTMLDAR